ncbi:MAG: helix-turn-helix transcriptional regulator [Acidimicrobiaceae bacterium]|nr:helix-turn-helix transcriptional regulator [Acidimicrobiaceae bacterium]
MSRTAPSQFLSSVNVAANPVVAEVDGLRLYWHARALRGDRSLAEAAKMVRLNRDELSRIEKGETTQIRFETLAKLLAGYGCDLADLFHVESTPSDAPRPLYEAALAALRSGVIEGATSRRRAVRRPSSLDIVDEADAQGFAPSPDERSARRRSPVGTLNNAR